jgi:5-methylcytosine-specific restriction endonuclease McrA
MPACTKCGEDKPIDAFSVDRSRKSGRKSQCRPCRVSASAAWAAANRERYLAYQREWYATNRESQIQYKAAHYAANRDRYLAKCAEWYEANRDRVIAERNARYAENPEPGRAAGRANYRRNPGPYIDRARRRRALLREATLAEFTHSDLLEAWEERGLSGCVYCPDGEFEHIDHVIPLIRGGAHSIENLVPSCARCNGSKGAKLLEEWLPAHQARLAPDSA